jgi:hypothetical protein
MFLIFASQLLVVFTFFNIQKMKMADKYIINIKRFPYLCLILH